MTRIIAVTSGKGGVGRTHLSVNLAFNCARQGLRTCLVDADFGGRLFNLLLRLAPRQTLADVIAGQARLRDVLLHGDRGFDIIPGNPTAAMPADLQPAALRELVEQLRVLSDYDLVILDTAFGLNDPVLPFVKAAPETLLVITPDPIALTDAYGLVKTLRHERYRGSIRVVVNQVESKDQALHTFNKFREVVRVYQNIDLPLLGWVPSDPQIAAAASQQLPVSVQDPRSPAAIAFARLANQLMQMPAEAVEIGAFLQRLTGVEVAAEASPSAAVTAPETAVAPIPDKTPPRPQARRPVTDVPFDDRLKQIASGLQTVARELARLLPATGTPCPPSAIDLRAARDGRAERRQEEVEGRPAGEPQIGRRAGEESGPARFVRNAQRTSPIDSLQLRRVVGRMLAKAAPDRAANDAPLQVNVDHVQINSGNHFNLRPGRYTQVSLECRNIGSPDGFIEEIFSNCAIAGCKVRQLGSSVRYWATTEQDGCIVLDDDAERNHCVRVYLAAGGNGLMQDELQSAEAPRPVASLRRVAKARTVPTVTRTELLAKYPHQRLDMGEVNGEHLYIYRLLRRNRTPLVCAFASADGDVTVSPNRGNAPQPGSGE